MGFLPTPPLGARAPVEIDICTPRPRLPRRKLAPICQHCTRRTATPPICFPFGGPASLSFMVLLLSHAHGLLHPPKIFVLQQTLVLGNKRNLPTT